MPAAASELYEFPADLRSALLTRLLMSWDGQWYLKVYDRFGWDVATELNARVRADYGRIEMRSVLRALRKRRADNLADAVRVLRSYYQLYGGAFEATYQTGDEQVDVLVGRCAALDGSRRARLERHDQACVACELLWPAWFRALLPGCEFTLEIDGRMGYGASRCHFVIRQLDGCDPGHG
jgi:hypothetical protein